MKFKNLLSLGAMLSCGLVAQAQVPVSVFHESFEAAQTKQPTDVGYYEEINKEEGDEWSIAEGGAVGKCFNFFNSSDSINANNFWRRAVKFRNLPLEAGKSYRLSFRFKGSNTFNDGEKDVKSKMKVGLMQGVENADISILGANVDKDQYREVSYFNPDAYETYNLMYYFADKAKQDAEYDKKCADKEVYAEANKDKYFATFNVFNPGDYYLDEVELVEANIAGIIYNGDVIRVDLGYATNAKTLAGTKGYYLLPNDCVSVKVGGSEVVVESVEARSDGYLYIFLAEAAEEGEVEVSFTNPAEGGLQYAEGEAITGNVLNFTEKAELKETFNVEGDIASWIYGEAQCVATTPIDGSFGLEGISEVTFTFDKEVFSGKNDINGGPVATLSDGTVLKLKEGTPELTKTLTFVSENGNFTKGSHAVTLSDVLTSKGTSNSQNTMLTFEVGKVQVSETVYTLEGSCTFPEANAGGIPEGWTVYSDGEERTSENTYGTGGRVFDSKAPQGKGIYTRANGQNLEEGALNGAVISPLVEIPAGDTEIRSFLAHWQNPSNIQVDVLNSSDEVVATAQFAPSVKAEGALNNDGFKFENCALRFTSNGGQYRVRYTLLTTGFNGMCVGGFDFYKVTETEGDKAESEVVAKGDFISAGNDKAPAHGTGWKVYRDDGRMRDPGANCSWGGDGLDWTGGGGPRVKTMGNKGMNGAAIYLAPNAYATYGEYLLQTDHGGTLEGDLEEKTLDLKNAKYQMTYNIIAWKNEGAPWSIQLDIYNQEDGITGTPVYTRKDEVSVHCNSANDASSEAKKIQFLWNAPKAGKYILKFTAGGECCVGNVTVETTSSLAVTYATLMNKNLEPAKEELETAKSNDNYAGSTRDALESMVAEYTNPDFHTVAEYTDAFAKLDAMVKKSATRRANIDKYPSALAAVEKGLNDAQGTKYEALEQFPIVQKAYNDYKDVDYIAMDDETLQKAVDEMGNNGSLISNMVSTCVPLLTKQLVDLSAAVVSLDETMVNHSYVIAAGNAISDDQELVNNLKTAYAAKLYKKIADGFKFSVFDEDMQEEVAVTIPASFLIQNANFYNTTVIPAGKENAPATVNDFPGWEVEVVSGNIQSLWSTGWGQKGASAVKPVEDCAVTSPWGSNHEYSAKQLVTMLPVAKYNASINVASDAADADNTPQHFAFVDGNEKQWLGTPNDDGSTTWKRDDATPVEFEDITPAVDGNYASLTIGAKLAKACFGKIDNATLTIVGKAEGFDYAKAAAALADEVAASIENAPAAPEGAPASVAYFDLSGRQVAQPQGVAIKVEKWANGYTKITKVVVK